MTQNDHHTKKQTETQTETRRTQAHSQARVRTFTEGKILLPLVQFALPVLADRKSVV